MSRVGPNQDINDPTTIINLAYRFQQYSDGLGDLLAQYNARNPNVTSGPTIINVSIPFVKIDGSTQLLYGDSISINDGIYSYDTNLVYTSTIITYVDLAERFRNYWETLNNIANQFGNWNYTEEEDIDPEEPFIGDDGNVIRIHGSLGGTSHRERLFSYSPSSPKATPDWMGYGPTDYNYITYPQLLLELADISIAQTGVSDISWETIYWYSKTTDAQGSSRSAGVGFGKSESFGAPLEQQYIQFYNNESYAITINLSISVSATFNTRFGIGVSSWAEIGNPDDYPDPFGGLKYLLPSFENNSIDQFDPSMPSQGGQFALGTNRIIEIPPNKSAFVGAAAGAGTTTVVSGFVGNMGATIVLEDETITHSADLSWIDGV